MKNKNEEKNTGREGGIREEGRVYRGEGRKGEGEGEGAERGRKIGEEGPMGRGREEGREKLELKGKKRGGMERVMSISIN